MESIGLYIHIPFCVKTLDLQPALRCNVRAEVKQMNIKQASEQSGVSAPNIRFYEKEVSNRL